MVQTLEGTAHSLNVYYDALNYYTNGNKLKSVQGGIKWGLLTRQRPTTQIKFFIRPKTKRMVPYSFFGIRVGVPITGSKYQNFAAGDTTDVTHVYAHLNCRYNEWHQDFNFKRA